MKNFNYYICAVAVLACANLSFGQDQKLTKSQLFTFEETVHDFGAMKQADGDVEYIFKFRNTGSAPVALVDVQPECGCTAPDKSRMTQETIQPGGEGEIPIGYEASTHPGEFFKKIKVITTKEKFEIAITGYVEPDNSEIATRFPELFEGVRFASMSLQFGAVFTDTSKTLDFEFFNGTTDTLQYVDSLQTLPAHLSLRAEPLQVPPGTTGHLFFTFDPMARADYGYVADYFQLILDTAMGPVDLAARATIQEYFDPALDKSMASKIELSGTTHDFGTVEKDAKVIHQFNFKNSGKDTLFVRKVGSTCSCIEAVTDKASYGPGEAGVVTVTFDTKRRKGKQRKSIFLIVNDPSKANHYLKLEGTVKSE